MTASTVVRPRAFAKAPGSKRQPKWLAKKYRRQLVATGAGAIVIAALLAVSLRHQAFAISHLTHVVSLEAWCMAVAIDAGYIAMENLSVFSATAAIRREINKWAGPTTIVLAVLSGALNIYAFNHEAIGWVEHSFATAIGAAIPGLLYATFRAVSYAYLSATK